MTTVITVIEMLCLQIIDIHPFTFISLHFSCYSCHSSIRQKQFHLQVIYFVKHCNTMKYDVFTINLQNVSCWFAWTKKSRFSAFFPHRAIVQKSCFPVGTAEGSDGESFPSGFLRVFFGMALIPNPCRRARCCTHQPGRRVSSGGNGCEDSCRLFCIG